MVKLSNIKRFDDIVVCDLFLEDCKIPVNLSYDEKSRTFRCGDLPKDYSWCSSHLKYAKSAIEKMCEKGVLEEEMTIMWY